MVKSDDYQEKFSPQDAEPQVQPMASEVSIQHSTDLPTLESTSAEVGDYVADENAVNKTNIELEHLYDEVRSSAESAAHHLLEGNRYLYRHLAKLLIWFHRANAIENYIKDLIKSKSDKVYKVKVSHGYNFAPIVDAVWMGINRKDLPVNKSNRISRALNRLYEIYGSQFNYRRDVEDDLVQYLVDNGGINGLVTYNSAQSDEDKISDIKADKERIKRSAELAKSAIQKAYHDSLNYFRAKNDLPEVSFANEIVVNEDEMSLVLVSKNSPTQYAMIDTVTDKATIAKALTKSYLGHYGVLPAAVRVLVETLATQCCPSDQVGTYTHLLNEAGKSSSNAKKNAIRRLTYKHDDGVFFLSAMHASNSIVTEVKPKIQVLQDPEDDVALSTVSRRALETNLISPKNFRMVQFSHDIGLGPIPSSRRDITHAINIKVLTARKDDKEASISLYFHRESTQLQAQSQVDVPKVPAQPPKWERKLSLEWFKKFNAAFTNNWVNSHARHLNREHQSVLEVLFRHSSLTVNFFNLDNECDLHSLVGVPTGDSKGVHRLSLLSKDLAVVMLQIADLPVVGDLQMSAYNNFLKLSYETEVGSYNVYIPAVNSTGEYVGHGFGQYSLNSLLIDADEFDAGDDITDEGDL